MIQVKNRKANNNEYDSNNKYNIIDNNFIDNSGRKENQNRHNKNGRIRILRPLFILILAVTLIAGGVSVAEMRTEPMAHIAPDYQETDLTELLKKDTFTDEDYRTILMQTGLGRPAVDDLKKEPGFAARVLQFQEDFFAPIDYVCQKLVFTTSQEYLVDENGRYTRPYELAPLKDGDILITKCAHTFGWRNGHAGIVVDAGAGQTVEAISLGQPSCYQSAESWTEFPSLIVLRLKDDTGQIAQKAAEAAEQYLVDVPYHITTGILGPKYMEPEEISGTHCSHLVWEAYRMFGIDLDSDGGRLVTVKDIANSPYLEVVQVYGADPEFPWP